MTENESKNDMFGNSDEEGEEEEILMQTDINTLLSKRFVDL
jgi:hypothetical protein